MGQITASAASTTDALRYGSQRHEDVCQNGVRWAVVRWSTGIPHLYYSTDDGLSWSDWGACSASQAESASLFIDLDDNLHLVLGRNSGNGVYYARATPSNAGRTDWTLGGETLASSPDSRGFPDVVAHRNPDSPGWTAHIAWGSWTSGAWMFSEYRRVSIADDGTLTWGSLEGAGFPNGNAQGGSYPSIDFHHTGDGKTVKGGTPHVYIGGNNYNSTFGYWVTARTYSGGSWGSPVLSGQMYSGYVGGGRTTCFWDGLRVVALINGRANSTYSTIEHREWDGATAGTFTNVATIYGPQGSTTDLTALAGTWDPQTRDVYVFTEGASTLESATYSRSGGTWSAWTVQQSSTDLQAHGVSATRASPGKDVAYQYAIATTGETYFDSIHLNSPPNAPTLTTPADGATIDRANTNRLAWQFSDPDAGDSQSAAEVRHRAEGTTQWDPVVAIGSPSQFWDAPGGTFPAGGREWQVRTADSQGEWGPWSPAGYFTAEDQPGAPTITAPTNGATIASEWFTSEWAASEQDAYQHQVLDDQALVVSDTGTVASGTARSRSVQYPTNNVTRTVRVRIKARGLWSPWASVSVTVSYTPPAAPTVTLTPVDADAELQVAVSHPTPGAGQPTVTHHDVWVDDGNGLERRGRNVAPTATWTHYSPVDGREYAGQVQVVAHGDNGTTTTVTA